LSVAATDGFHSMWTDASIATELTEDDLLELWSEVLFLMMESDELTSEEKLRMYVLMHQLVGELASDDIDTEQDLPIEAMLAAFSLLTDDEDVSQDPLLQQEQQRADVGPLTDCVHEGESVCHLWQFSRSSCMISPGTAICQ